LNQAIFAIGAGLLLLGAIVWVRELRWRGRIASELSSEIALGILTAVDYQALCGWKRFRSGWLSGPRERRTVCRMAGRLARAKAAQRRAAGDNSRLLQVEVLTLRTRLRQIRGERSPLGGVAGNDILTTP
jgi:hypothetical protein